MQENQECIHCAFHSPDTRRKKVSCWRMNAWSTISKYVSVSTYENRLNVRPILRKYYIRNII